MIVYILIAIILYLVYRQIILQNQLKKQENRKQLELNQQNIPLPQSNPKTKHETNIPTIDSNVSDVKFDLKPVSKKPRYRKTRHQSSHKQELNKETIIQWASEYDKDHPWWNEEEKRIGNKIHEENEFGLETLYEIIHWKFYTLPGREKRTRNLIQDYEDQDIRKITKKALSSDKNDRNRLKTLTSIKGIGVSLASTILSLYDPDNFCVYDIHVMREIYGQEPKYMFTGYEYYIELLQYLRKESKRLELPVRTIEKALFKKNLS